MTKIVCSVCGSEDVQAKVWTKPNENFDRTCDFIDELIAEPADCWCCNCEENQKLVIVEEETPTDYEPETFHCELCGSTDVMSKSWVLPNLEDKPVRDGVEDSDGWCNECNENSTIVTCSELMESVNVWWNEASFEDMEIITGLESESFQPDELGQKFVDACAEIWDAKPEEERIEIWRKIRHLGVYANE